MMRSAYYDAWSKEKFHRKALLSKAFPLRSQALVLNAYMDYLQYQSMQEKSDREIKIPRSVLLARSRLPATDDGLGDIITRFSSRPDQGHGTDRFRLGIGHNKLTSLSWNSLIVRLIMI